MTENVPPHSRPYDPVRVRRPELIRSADRRRHFESREAQRRLQEKEHPHWALIAYAVFLAAVLVIFGVTYTTYAFSKYRGEVLPGVRVDTLSIAGMTPSQARRALDNQLYSRYFHPVRLVYTPLGRSWAPTPTDIGYQPQVKLTVQEAMNVGRQGSVLEQLIDRLPLHPIHVVSLVYRVDGNALQTYIRAHVVQPVYRQQINANLKVNSKTNHIVLVPSQPGRYVDVPHTTQAVNAALGALNTQTVPLSVHTVPAAIPDAYALNVRARIEQFLASPPVIAVGKRVIATDRATFAPMMHFQQVVGKGRATLVMKVDSSAIERYVAQVAQQVDHPAVNAKIRFDGKQIHVLAPRRTGRTLQQNVALQRLLAAVTGLKPHARLRFPVQVTQPPIDLSNPASVGINTLLSIGVTSFHGAPDARLTDITAIASRLNNDLLPPDQDISFNALVGTGWSASAYDDRERQVGNRLVPAAGGGMQQVATTFLRALYAAGLKVIERHSHPYRLAWYEPPVGLDAVVSPLGDDLRFHNTTGKYLLVETRVEPIRRELYIYVYGPPLRWKVQVDALGKISKVYPHGPTLVRQDPSLPDGEVKQTAWAHDGADTDVARTITYSNGNVHVDHIYSHYQPWRAVRMVGAAHPTPTPTPELPPTPGPKKRATPEATPTPTFDH